MENKLFGILHRSNLTHQTPLSTLFAAGILQNDSGLLSRALRNPGFRQFLNHPEQLSDRG
jgi:hypothetical protein